MLGCGTVIASSPERSLVRITREKCSGCPGVCMRFGKKDAELWLDEQIPLGAEVEIESSPYALVGGTLITLGIPLLVAGFIYLVTQSWMYTLGATLLSILFAIGCCRTEKFRLLLVPRVRNVV